MSLNGPPLATSASCVSRCDSVAASATVSVGEAAIELLAGIVVGIAAYSETLRYADPKVYQGVKHHIGLAIGGLPYLSR